MDKDFMLNYFNKAVQPEWEELLKTPRYQPAASKRDAIEREFFRMLNDEQKRKYLVWNPQSYWQNVISQKLCI